MGTVGGNNSIRRTSTALLGLALLAPSAFAEDKAPSPDPEYVEVTATRIPEPVNTVPASITIITGDDLRNRGVRDLRGALALAAGIDIAPGGDGGPASSVPEFWGLREFDAFLLVVDGVPWGGAFNPALATLDLSNVERIEVMRGPAPVMYGATSFVGVIQVIRKGAGAGLSSARASGGSYGSGSLAGTLLLQPGDPKTEMTSSLGVDLERVGYRDDRTQYDREHLLWRASILAFSGTIRLDADATWLQQDPSSPVPREGEELSSQVPLDANHNLSDAKLNERRFALVTGYDRDFGSSTRWVSTLSAHHSNQTVIRGFLTDVSNTDPNANGMREGIDVTDVYFDTHVELTGSQRLRWVAGIDDLYGVGRGEGGDFDYFVDLDGNNPPAGEDIPFGGEAKIRDTRNFAGLYGQVEWTPLDAWRFELGARLNHTSEARDTSSHEIDTGISDSGSDDRNDTRGSGSAGITWTAWHRNDDAIHLYANYKNTFKPAAIDFGLDAEPEILDPETAVSYEGGFKGRFANGAFEAGVSAFQMDFNNLVVSTSVGGLPALENAGESRLRGIEANLDWRIPHDLYWRLAYSLHDARFRDYVTEFDGVPTQLAGNRLEMSARYMAATGLVYAPGRGLRGSVDVNWIGSRYLNKRNTALTPDYVTWSAGAGYRWTKLELRVDGTNLNDQRPPVSESELGDAQYYLLTARRITVSANWTF